MSFAFHGRATGRLNAASASRERRRGRLCAFESLENRTVLSSVNVNAGELIYLANSAGLTVSTTGPGGTYTLTDNQAINLLPGAVSAGWSVNGDTATGPNNSITSISLTSNQTADSFTINSVDASATINSGAGNDTIFIAANGVPAADSVTVDNTITNGNDGDTLQIGAGGTKGTLSTGAASNATYQASGAGLITYQSVKPGFQLQIQNVAAGSINLNINGDITTPTPLDTTITNTAGSLAWTTKNGGTTLFADSVPISALDTASVAGTTAGENLTLDYSGGDPLPASGLTFDPAAAVGQAVNSLTLQGGEFTSEAYTGTGAGAGKITYDGTTTITFSNLSPVTDTVPSPTFTFTAPLAAQTVNINTGPIVGGTQTDQINDGGTGTFELVNFANKTVAVANVNNSGATTTVNIPSIAAALSTLSVVSNAGTDTINLQAVPTGLTVDVDTGAGAGSTTNVGLAGSLGAIGGPVFVKSTGGVNALALNDSGETSGQTYTIAGSRVTSTSFPSFVDFSGGGIATLSLTSGGHGDTFDFTGPVQSSVTAYNFSADSGPGPNTLNVTSNVAALGVGTVGVISFGAGAPVVSYVNFQKVNVTKPATPPAGMGVSISAVEGQLLNNVIVASFTEADLGNSPANFVATINWGDGTPASAGVIQANGLNNYDIIGSHTYAASGTFTVNVTLTDLGSMGSTTVGGTLFTVTSNGPVNSIPNPILSVATVAAASLSAQGATVTGIEGSPLNPAPGGDVLVATFMDSGAIGTPADYTASIAWGDGTTSTPTRITSQGTPNGVVFSVFGNNTYKEEGVYQITVTITKTASGATAIASGQAVIADAALTAGGPVHLMPSTGITFSGSVVGSFSDANTAAPKTDFTAVIDWGDGSPTSLGTIAPVSGGVFDILGTHAYTTPTPGSSFVTTINVQDVGGSTVTVVGSATVTDGTPTGVFAPIKAVEEQSTGSIVLATITDPNPLATASDLSAMIDNWGDNLPLTPQPLTVVLMGATSTDSTFGVLGSHTYKEEGSNLTFTMTVTTLGGVATVFTPATGTANVADAPLTSSNGTTITGIEGATPPPPVLLGTFTDANQLAAVTDFTSGGGSVVVNWGDGTPVETLPATDLAPVGSANGVIFTITAAHPYAEEGTFAYNVTVTDAGGATTIISGSAVIADAKLTASPTQPTVNTIEAAVFPIPEFGKPVFYDQPVASFTDANLSAPLTDFTATIDWGDGAPLSAGTVTQPLGIGNPFVVTGSHTYADAGTNGVTGTYPIQVFVVDVGGSTLTVHNVANVADRAIVITGQLNPASDSGVSDTDDITDVKQPDFFGTSEAYSHVTLFATALGGGPIVQIGQGQASGNGAWNIVSNVPLADGSYVITATAVDQFGETTGGPTTITSDLVIDTVGPVITNVVWNRLNGQVDYVIQDPSPATGVNVATLLDSANYNFTKVHANKAYPGKWIVTNIAVSPGAATSSYDVAVTFNSGETMRGGFYLFTIRDSTRGPSSVQDIAGNDLDGEFYGSFPSGNKVVQGDFVAMLSGYHDKIFAPQTIVGTASAANGGVGGPPIGKVHSGVFSRVIPRGGSPVFFTPPVATARHLKLKASARPTHAWLTGS